MRIATVNSQVKHFRKLAEAFRAEAREEIRQAKAMQKQKYISVKEMERIIEKAKVREELGKRLKALAKDVLDGNVSIL